MSCTRGGPQPGLVRYPGHTGHRVFWTFLLAVALLLPLPLGVAAQGVTGRITERGSGAPVHGALVLIVDESENRIAGTLTGLNGGYALKSPKTGILRIRVERIGYSSAESSPRELNPGAFVHLDLALDVMPVSLEGIRVEGEQRCVVGLEEAPALAATWDEARKALEGQRWTEEAGHKRYRVSLISRRLNGRGDQVLAEDREPLEILDKVPFQSLPVNDLLEGGFVRPVLGGATHEYLAPDAAVLLSDEFLDTHCFRLAEHDWLPGLIGLSFEPTEDRGGKRDIRGTLWINRATSELGSLDYLYTWNPVSRSKRSSGGRLDFHRLPDGAWIITSWSIRMPTRVGYSVTGAEVEEVLEPWESQSPPTTATDPPSPDTLQVTKDIRGAIREKNRRESNDRFQPLHSTMAEQASCSADLGQACFGIDPDTHPCPIDQQCHSAAEVEVLRDSLVSAARAHPAAGFVTGLAIYALLKDSENLEAHRLAQSCSAEPWWCEILQAYVFHRSGRSQEAIPHFEAGIRLAPDSVRATLHSPSLVLAASHGGALGRLPSDAVAAVSDSIWWLSDPLWSVPGNDRFFEHICRGLETRFFYFQVRDSDVGSLPEWLKDLLLPWRIPRGTWDSWRWLSKRSPTGYYFEPFTSQKAARYHFVPDFNGEGFSQPTWRLLGSVEEEGYTPSYGEFHHLPIQVARFRRADSMLVAAAATMADSDLSASEEASAHLLLSDSPGSFPIQLSSAIHKDRAVFLGQVPPNRYVTSLEVHGAAGFGRHRLVTEPLQTEGPGVSDILLYRQAGGHEPDSLLIAAGMMLGETAVESGTELGIYWETYGSPAGESVTADLEVTREDGGILGSITRLFSGESQERGRLSWKEPSPGPVFRNSLILDLGEMDQGKYVIHLRTSWAGQQELKTERVFEVR